MKRISNKIITCSALLGSALLFLSCSSRGNEAAAIETADQIENARIEGREAARSFVNKDWRDSLELQGHLIEAGIKRAAYDSLPQQRAAYDSAFISTVRTVRPEIAVQLHKFQHR